MTKFECLCNEYRENKRLIEELNALNESLKTEIIKLMGDRDEVTEGASRATNKTVKSVRLDGTALKKAMPELYETYSIESSYKRFCVN